MKRGDGAMAEAALGLDGVSAGYGETVVLENIRLSLGASETLSIIGRNGVGKSTLLATIMGHTTLHGASIRFRRSCRGQIRAPPACRGRGRR